MKKLNSKIIFLLVFLFIFGISYTVYSNLSNSSLRYVNYFLEKEECSSVIPFAVDLYDNIYGYFLFHEIDREITKGLKTDKEKMFAVADWVFNNILQKELSKYSDIKKSSSLPIIDDNYLNVALRGYGFCDQSAYVFATMMHFLGFETSLLMLKDDRGISLHTVALVRIEGKDGIVSTTYKFIFKTADNELIPKENLRYYPDVFAKYKKIITDSRNEKLSDIKIEWFENGVYFKTFPFCDKIYLINKVKDKLKACFSNLVFAMPAQISKPSLSKDTPKEDSFLQDKYLFSYNRARVYVLLGRLSEALDVLNSIKIEKDQRSYIYVLFQKAHILYSLKRYEEAKDYFSQIISLKRSHFYTLGANYFLKKIDNL